MQLWLPVAIALVTVTFLGQSESSLLDGIFKIVPPKFVIGFSETLYQVIKQLPPLEKTDALTSRQYGRQALIPDNVPFPCDVTQGRSPERPTSVHALRPGDIDVVAAMGDSLTGAFGAKATYVAQVPLANRGVSFSSGGEGTWRDTLTLPNILREFNPNLVGYATGDALSWQRPAELNVAEGFATVQDMPHQALLLVKRMKEDPRIDFEKDWKLITIYIGHNDICTAMCIQNLTRFYEDQTTFILKALDVFHDRMPRVFVNLLPTANLINTLDQFRGLSPGCRNVFHAVECSCIGLNTFRFANQKEQQLIAVDKVGQFIEDIMKLDLYKDREDFAVVVQPFNRDIHLPVRFSRKYGKMVTDYSYLAPDCFHLSQKGHALSANALWNNMLQPVGNKSRDVSPPITSTFLCPNQDQPYIYTGYNTSPV